MANKLKIINDPVHGFIKIPYEIIFDIMEHRCFQRLRRISQTGLLSLIFPGATHTRFHHAIGTMHLMFNALEILKQKGVKISTEEEKGAMLAVLLHDVGHGPFFACFGKYTDGQLASRKTFPSSDGAAERGSFQANLRLRYRCFRENIIVNFLIN